MDPGIKNPKTRPDPNFHYPSPTRARLLIPGQYPKPDMLPAGTRHFLMIIIKIARNHFADLICCALAPNGRFFLAAKNFHFFTLFGAF